LTKEFLIQRDRGKNGIKNFWISRAIKINSGKIKQIKWINQGLRFNQSNSGCNLGTETHLGANWGSQTYTHRIREERGYDTCQHLIGPPQHVSATCQHLIGPPHPCGSHMSDKWVPLMPRGSQPMVRISCHITRQIQMARSDWTTSQATSPLEPHGHL
jgi:hypothetical protein